MKKTQRFTTTQQIVEHLNATYPTGSFVVFSNKAARATHFAIIKGFVVDKNPMFVEPHFVLYSSEVSDPTNRPLKFLRDCARFALANSIAIDSFRPMTVDEACKFYDSMQLCKLTFDPFDNNIKPFQ